MVSGYCNFYWQTQMPGERGNKRFSAATMARPSDNVSSLYELFKTMLNLTKTMRDGLVVDALDVWETADVVSTAISLGMPPDVTRGVVTSCGTSVNISAPCHVFLPIDKGRMTDIINRC